MAKRFRPDLLDQVLLLAPSLHDWLPEGHLARFVAEVIGALDMSAIYRVYDEGDGRGQAAYAPPLMTRLLLYGYCTGVVSSRQIERATDDNVAFRYLAADSHPDHDTIAAFRQRHLTALAGLFTQALPLCQKAGLVQLGHVALDGTKVKANASKHKAMSYGRMSEAEQKLQQEVEALLRQAEATDAAEGARYGKGRQGDELPDELARRESRLTRIREAKAALEIEARQRVEAQKAAAEAQSSERRIQGQQTSQKAGGRASQVPDPAQAKPAEKAQRNFTDPDSRIMPDGAHKGSFVQAYNAQAAVDSHVQIIVAAEITQDTTDYGQLIPLLEQVEANMGQKPTAASADAGYWSEANVSNERVRGIDLHIATGRQKHGEQWEPASDPPLETASARQKMRHKLRTAEGQALYRMRKAIVEPVFGQMKEQRGFRQFRLRGLAQVRCEWKLICLGHNLLKLFRGGWRVQPA
jgi:transposase